MAVAITGCDCDLSKARNRHWTRHRWSCTGCGEELRTYAGLGWHHYIQLTPITGNRFTVGYVDVPGTAMPPRRALFELDCELRPPARPRLYLVPPPADHHTTASPLAA